MKTKFLFASLALLGIMPAEAANPGENHANWQLVFEDDFNGTTPDMNKWGRINYVNWAVADWRRYQSTDSELVEIRKDADGTTHATLWGKYGDYTSQNDQTGTNDTYACGGIWTANTFSFQYGYVEVRARFDCVGGVWPAIWMLPANGASWPNGGEIDIMEHLNYQGSVYQTIHYSYASDGKDTGSANVFPDFATYGGTTKNDWNTYGIEWTESGISFYLNGIRTGTFSRVGNNDWPFDDEENEFYLIIDQQIGGKWVEDIVPIDQATLANEGAAFDIDYVKVYSTPNYMHAVPEPASTTLSLLSLAAVAMRRRR